MTCLGPLALPLIGAPMFLVSHPELVLAQCLSGVVGSFPALNARPAEQLHAWLAQISRTLELAREAAPARLIAPYAVNLIVHAGNPRLEADLAACIEFRVPLVITSLSSPGDLVHRVHAYGGRVFHDVTTVRHAEKALSEGVDGLILVCAGAGGHGGLLNPFAFTAEVRRFWGGPLVLAGALTEGRHILAAQVMGADYAYMGTRFIASKEAQASPAYQQALVDARSADIVYTDYFTGIPGNYLKASLVAAGLDPAHLPERGQGGKADFGKTAAGEPAKAWRDIWGAGQGVGNIGDVLSVEELVGRLKREYETAKSRV